MHTYPCRSTFWIKEKLVIFSKDEKLIVRVTALHWRISAGRWASYSPPSKRLVSRQFCAHNSALFLSESFIVMLLLYTTTQHHKM